MERLKELWSEAFGFGQALSPLAIGSFILFAFLIYLIRKEKGSFWAFLFPRDIWMTTSTQADIFLLVLNRILGLFGLFARFAAAPAIAAWVAARMPGSLFSGQDMSPWMMAFIIFAVSDFATYWVHRLHHDTKILWPLHAVHHSASVLTPLTAARQHPVSGIMSSTISSLIFGVTFGVLVGVFSPDLTFAEIAGANAFVVLFNMTVTNFQHSHIWISFGPALEHIFISPAQHQVHHSVEPRHFNRNYGQALAIWDWMFGTLYVNRERETVTFGLEGKADAPLMTHRFMPLLIDPVRRLLRAGR